MTNFESFYHQAITGIMFWMVAAIYWRTRP